jgi:hypothetical protein
VLPWVMLIKVSRILLVIYIKINSFNLKLIYILIDLITTDNDKDGVAVVLEQVNEQL